MAQCDLTSDVASGTDEHMTRLTLSADGQYVAFEDDDGTPDGSTEGVYLAPTDCATGQSLFIQGAADPFWTPAGLYDEPTVTIGTPASPATLGSSARFAWTGTDHGTGLAHYQYRKQVAAYNGGFGAWSAPTATAATSVTLTGLRRGSDYCLGVRALDPHGQAGPWTTRCVAVALDDRSLTASRGWTRATGRAYYAGTVTRTTKLNTTLKRASAQVDRVGVVATTCPTCGKVGVYVGSTRIGVINLHASATHTKVVKLLPTSRLRTGTVTVKVLTNAKSVAVDGLVLSRT